MSRKAHVTLLWAVAAVMICCIVMAVYVLTNLWRETTPVAESVTNAFYDQEIVTLHVWFASARDSLIISDQKAVENFAERLNQNVFRPRLVSYHEAPPGLEAVIQFITSDGSLLDLWLYRYDGDKVIAVTDDRQFSAVHPSALANYIHDLI